VKTTAIIQARMGSKRLPGKVLFPVKGKPLLGWMLDRLSVSNQIDQVIIATSIDKSDDAIEKFAHDYGCEVYRGSHDDVLDRYYQTARSLKTKPDFVVRLTADCPLIDSSVIDEIIESIQNTSLDFVSNSEPLPSSWPDGMDVSVMSYSALKKAWKIANKPSEREHVTFIFWKENSNFKCKRVDCYKDLSKYRLTVDYEEDFVLIKKIILNFINKNIDFRFIKMNEIIDYLESYPDLIEINNQYSRGEGWKDSFEKDKLTK